MRILFFGTYFQFRGKETYISDEIDSVVKYYPNISYLVYNVNCPKNQTKRYHDNILLVERKSLKNIKTVYHFLLDIIKIFIKFKPELIHSVYVIESLIMGILGKIFRIPSIFHSRGTDFNYDPFISIKSNILARITAKLNNKIITVSKVMRFDAYRLKIPLKKVIPVYDGIDFSLFNPKSKQIPIGAKKLEILHIGRFDPVKNHELIIKTCKDLRDNNIQFHFTFTGYGDLENKLLNLIDEYNLKNWVKFAGYTDHDKIPEFLSKGDLYIQTSFSEGMPISVLEAMSMNLPVILTKVGGMPELIKNSGGILIDVDNKKQLYEAILFYSNNPERIEMDGKRNGNFVRKKFNWKNHAEKLNTIYLNLIKKRV